MRYSVLVLLLTGSGFAAPNPDRVLEPFQGTWEYVEGSEGGQARDMGKLKDLRITFSGSEMEWPLEAGKKLEKFTITVRADRKPAEIDLTVTIDNKVVTTLHGIYEFEDGKLRIALGTGRESVRPESFKSAAESKSAAVVVLKKAK